MMTKEEFIRVCEGYCKGKPFQLNPDKDFLNNVIDGVMKKQEQTGLKYCPCRLGDTWEYLCPCNFEIQETWKNKEMCWCGLFVKK